MTDMSLESLEPKNVWSEFLHICTIPHGSGNIDALRASLRKRAEAQGFKCFEDGEAGNLLIVKEADPGFEMVPTICLQGHMDMVCSKRSDCPHDFTKDPIQPKISTVDGVECVVASGTTLGADNGIGVAVGLAIIGDKNLKTGRIEVLCTKDEETTMHGVHHISGDFLKAKYLLNLDSEDIGVVTIGSAGGFCGDIEIPQFAKIESTGDCKCHHIKVHDLQGGHSGVDIHHYRANANKLLGRLLHIAVEFGGQICSIRGGTAHNAIPMDAEACVCFEKVEDAKISAFVNAANIAKQEIIAEFKSSDPNIKISIVPECSCKASKCCCGGKCSCVSNTDSKKIVSIINLLPSQVLRMSADVHGLVESSINLGTVNFCSQKGGQIVMLARSSINSYLPVVNNQLQLLSELHGFKYTGLRDAYGGWAPNVNSPLLKATIKQYALALGKKESDIKVEAIHAGLECGELISKYPGLEAVSIGPTIKNPHSDRELLQINTVAPFYEVVVNVIKELSK